MFSYESDLGLLLGLVVIIFLIVLAILWLLLPFAVFNIRDRIGELIGELKRLNAEVESQLREIREELKKQQPKDRSDENYGA